MKIVSLSPLNIRQVLKLESDNIPDKSYYSRYSQKDLEFLFNNPESCGVFGLFDKEKMIGWGAYRTDWKRHKNEKGVYEVGSIVVDKNYRRLGFGTKILNYIIDIIEKKTTDKRIFLTVSPKNIPAIQLYLKRGFVVYDFQKDVYGHSENRVYLELKLEKRRLEDVS